MGPWQVTTSANCTTKGVETRECTLDAKHTETQETPIDPTVHQWGEWDTETALTCTTVGKGSRICLLNQNHKETDQEIPALGHDYAWAVTTALTCSAQGEETGTCTHDESHTTTRAIPIDPTAHDWEQLTGTAPTCTETGSGKRKCRICNIEEPLNIIPALGHDYQNWTQTTAPTCTTAGVETGTCTHDPTHTTTRIGADALGHNYQWVTITAPTETTDGEETEICSHDSTHTRGTRTTNVGDGTTANPFRVYNVTTLSRVGKGTGTYAAWSLSAHYRQTDDIDLSSIANWSPIGNSNSSSTRFSGTYDGGGFTIANLTINNTLNTIYPARGLFGYVSTTGTICNVGLIDVNITSTDEMVGGVVGHNYGYVYNCYTSGNISSSFDSSGNVGGVVGYVNGGTVISCYSTANVTGVNNVGGVVGSNYNGGKVQNCVALNASITRMDPSSRTSFGRVVGLMITGGTLSNNYGMSPMTFPPITVSSNTTGIHGGNVTNSSPNGGYNNQTFWQNTIGWDFTNIWEMGGTPALPILKKGQ